MRVLILLACAAACSGKSHDEPPAEVAKPPPPCTRTLVAGTVYPRTVDQSLPFSVGAAAFAFLDERTLAVLYYEMNVTERLDGGPRGPDDRLGLALYDLRHAYQTTYVAETHTGIAPDYMPAAVYPIDATQMVLRWHSRALMFAGPAGLASFDVATGCLRTLALAPRRNPDAVGPFGLVAFDREHGRFFAITERGLVRVDDDLEVAVAVAAPRDDIRELAYDETSDRLIARTRDGALLAFSGATLAAGPVIPLRLSHDQTSILQGPWLRPGHHEAIAEYFVPPPPCPPDPAPHDEAMLVRNGCTDPPGTGRRLALFDLVDGRELRSADGGLDIRAQGAWSDNGDVFLADNTELWPMSAPHPMRLAGVHGFFSLLDTAGRTYVTAASSSIFVVDIASGKPTWEVITPHVHGAERPR